MMQLHWVCFFLAFFIIPVLAAPAANVTVTTYGSKPGLQATFASEPRGRGTISILISCTATFLFCIWTALRPNVVPGVSAFQRASCKAALAFISVIVPEGVLICAFGEWRDAKDLVEAWKEESKIIDKKKLNMEIAYFVVMGGFYIDQATKPTPAVASATPTIKAEPGCPVHTKHDAERLTAPSDIKPSRLRSFFKRNKKTPVERPYRAVLTPTGFKKYLKAGLIHEESFDNLQIKDKSKTSLIAKIVTGIQALYLVVECAARWGSDLPLTLLEIHVLIQVVRTTVIVFFWWEKPLDVNEPIRLGLRRKGLPDTPPLYHIAPSENAITPIVAVATPPVELANHPIFQDGQEKVLISQSESLLPDEDPRKCCPLSYGNLEAEIKKSLKYSPNESPYITKQSPHTFIAFQSQAAYDIIIQIDVGDRSDRDELSWPSKEDFKSPHPQDEPRSPGGPDELDIKSTHGQNDPGSLTKQPVKFKIFLFIQAALVCLTGALHAVAWNSHFPTTVEMWLWRGSSMAMCCCCLMLFLIANFTEYEQDLIAAIWYFHMGGAGIKKREFLCRVRGQIALICRRHAVKQPIGRRRIWSYWKHHIGIWLTLFFVMVYFFSVFYITVESYLSLRSPLLGSFNTVAWTNYWPHV